MVAMLKLCEPLAPSSNINAMNYILLCLDLHTEVRIVGF